MKSIFRGLLALSWSSLPGAVLLREVQAPTTAAATSAVTTAPVAVASAAVTGASTTTTIVTLTTTTNPVLDALAEQEWFLDSAENRMEKEVVQINADLKNLNTSVNSWSYSIGVIKGSRAKVESEVQNNTEFLARTSKTSSFQALANKTKALHQQMAKYNASVAKFKKSLIGGNKDTSKSSTTGNANPLEMLPRVTKVQHNFLLNGTKMERLLRSVKRLEGDLSVNATEYTERVLRRQTDDALAVIQNELQGQLASTMTAVAATKSFI